MKVRLLTLLAIIFLLGNVSFAQGVGAYKAKRTELVKKKNLAPQRQGLFIMPEVGADFSVGWMDSGLSLQALFGYEFNNHFALGIGTGVIGSSDLDYIISPLFLSIHGDFSKHKTTAYYRLDIGTMIPIKKEEWSISHYHDHYYGYDKNYRYIKGFTLSPEVGIRANNCYIGIRCTIATVRSERYCSYSGYINEGQYTDCCFLSLKFGYKIPLKNVKL